MEFKLKSKSYILVDTMFLLNSIVSFLPLPIAIFYLLGSSVTEEQISLLFSLKFWGVAVFSFLITPLLSILSIKHILLLSFIIRFLGYSFISFEMNMQGVFVLVLLSSISAALFSVSSKLYIQNTSENIEKSLSKRFVLNNLGVAISPIFTVLFDDVIYIISMALLLIVFLVVISIFLDDLDVDGNYSKKNSYRGRNIYLYMFIFISCMLFSVFFLFYEKNIPILLESSGRSELYVVLTWVNTVLIILFQAILYRFVTNLVGVYNSMYIGFLLCFLSFIPVYFGFIDFYYLFVFVIGITYLEMFFSTSLDSIIIKNAQEESKSYFIFFNLFLAVCISLSSLLLMLGFYSYLIIIILLCSLFFIGEKLKKNLPK